MTDNSPDPLRPLTCEQACYDMHSFVEDELTYEESNKMIEHLDACEACAHVLREHEQLRAALRGVPWESLAGHEPPYLFRRD
ncbi:MAG: anti-sigma factor family protein [Fimbriimonadales bacterium]